MIILNLSTTDKQGAGSFAAYFNNLFNSKGFKSYLVVKNHFSKQNINTYEYRSKKYEYIIEKFKRSKLRRNFNESDFEEKYIFYNKYEQSTCYSSKSILKLLPAKPDVIFIHWVSGFVNYKIISELKILTNAQIIILMIDNAPITGGCHYPWDCKGYMYECKNCPAVIDRNNDLAHNIFLFKRRYVYGDEKVIAFSNNDSIRLKAASLFKNNPKFSIVAPVNENKFKPLIDTIRYQDLKQQFGLSTNKTLILVAATFLNEERKGMKLLLKALKELDKSDFCLLIAGNNTLDVENYNYRSLGYLNEEELITSFQIADVFACPTIEDSGPIMINQSIMIGTPVVAFKTGVAEDIVIENETGYLAEKGNYIEFANGLKKIISQNSIERQKMKQNCRDFALKTYSEDVFLNRIEQIISNSTN